MNKNKVLNDAYEKLQLIFKFNEIDHLHINYIDITHFYNKIGIKDQQNITKGSKCFTYHNIYEVLLWYNYYAIKYKHIQKNVIKDNKLVHYCNRSYFSRISKNYKNIHPKKGLKIIKIALDNIILKHDGIPKYYDKTILDNIFYISK